MKPKVVVTREIFDDSLALLAQHCEVLDNQADVPYAPDTLAAKLAGCEGLMCALTDKVDAALLVVLGRRGRDPEAQHVNGADDQLQIWRVGVDLDRLSAVVRIPVDDSPPPLRHLA